MYDSTLGRFLVEDPVSADINLYRYGHNDPINSRDPSGMADEVKAKMTVSLEVQKENDKGEWVKENPVALSDSGGYKPGLFAGKPTFTETLETKPVEVDVAFWEGNQNGKPTYDKRRIKGTIKIEAFADEVKNAAGSEVSLTIKNVHIEIGTWVTGIKFREVKEISVQVKSDDVKKGATKAGESPIKFKLDKNYGVLSVKADVSGTITCYENP